jgi:zinc protease
MRICVRLLWPLALCGVASFAQPQPEAGSKSIPLSKVERKNEAPVSRDILRVQLPKPVEFKLDDGLTVLVLENHRLPTVTVRLLIQGAGALNDPADLPGLANLTAAMLKEGTTTRSSKQIAEDIERLGATINVTAPFGSDTATLTASGLSDNLG